MNSSLLLQQYSACLVCLIRMVFEMGGRWPNCCCFVACYFQDLFNIACSIFVPSFFSICLVSVYVVHPYSSIDTIAVWTKLCFILLDKFDFCVIFACCILVSFSVHEMLLSTSFRKPPFSEMMSPFWLQHILHFVCIHMEADAACCRLCWGRCICQKCYVLCIVCICNSLCGVSSCLFYCKAIFFH